MRAYVDSAPCVVAMKVAISVQKTKNFPPGESMPRMILLCFISESFIEVLRVTFGHEKTPSSGNLLHIELPPPVTSTKASNATTHEVEELVVV